MISVVLLAIVANTYFIQPDYSFQWDTLDIQFVAESRPTLLVKPALDIAVRKIGTSGIRLIQKAFSNNVTYKWPRDKLTEMCSHNLTLAPQSLNPCRSSAAGVSFWVYLEHASTILRFQETP